MKIIIRSFNPATDIAFIYGTLIRGIYFGAVDRSVLNLGPFTANLKPYVQDLLDHAKINIVSSIDAQEFLLGYSIIKPNKLEWIFVKPNYRNQGIATMLLKNEPILSFNEQNLTNAGKKIMEEHNIFNPKKEELDNEQNLRESN